MALQRAVLPSLDHISYTEYEHVYEPAEDSYLLCDALLQDVESILALSPSLVVEIGPGTGVATTYLCQLLKRKYEEQICPSPPSSSSSSSSSSDKHQHHHHSIPHPLPLCIAVDVNRIACATTLRTAQANHVGSYVDVVQGDLLSPFIPYGTTTRASSVSSSSTSTSSSSSSSQSTAGTISTTTSTTITTSATATAAHSTTKGIMNGKVDVLLFNPPYVPTPDDEVLQPSKCIDIRAGCSGSGSGSSGGETEEGDVLVGTWAGGLRGRRVLDRAIPVIITALQPHGGIAYIVLVQENDPEEVSRIFTTWYDTDTQSQSQQQQQEDKTEQKREEERKISECKLTTSIVCKVKAKNEDLMIMKVVKTYAHT